MILKKKLESIGVEIIFEDGIELIIQFTGSPNEIVKIEKILKPFKIIEQTRSGLVSMATGTKYIKK